MTLNLTPTTPGVSTVNPPRITVVGVGGGGGNAVDNMISTDLKSVEFLVANTDAQQLANSNADIRVQLGPTLTRGLGAGAKPDIGRQSAEEVEEEIRQHLTGVDLVFITAGMGGGTGTGAAPVIARIARENGALTIGVVSKPFQFEGMRRCRAADAGIIELQKYVDTLIVIPNQNLFSCATQTTTLIEAFKMADDVLYKGVRSITDLMVVPGKINLDFADVKTVMGEMGKAMMGTGAADSATDGQDWATMAAERAISNPLLEETSIRGARGLLINVTGGPDLGLHDYTNVMERIREEAHEEAEIIGGLLVRDDMSGSIQVSVVATGIAMQNETASIQPPAAPATAETASKTESSETESPQPKKAEEKKEELHQTASHANAAQSEDVIRPAMPQPVPQPRPVETRREDTEPEEHTERENGFFSRFFRSRSAVTEQRTQRTSPFIRPQQEQTHSVSQPTTDNPHQQESAVQQDEVNLDIPAYLRRPQ
ncbi:cell division protein FtsZ [Aristophania vespae]|uniref:Cell division protein FtsZ n=1 Tax=Aristophania vespae TaxID=2697033 RepID=A0A6P1NJA7_9PROT|nr:cell division protein FtsZ [Aristophania vespae]QHI95752.1 cell division protein FtsZ [Aristophania vespae]